MALNSSWYFDLWTKVMENQGSFWVIIVIVLIALPIVAYFVAQHLKGSIEINLPTTSFNPGETIKGFLIIRTKKPVKANRLLATFVGCEVHLRRSADGKEHRDRQEIYRDERPLECKTEYPAGAQERVDFELRVPQKPVRPENNMGQVLGFLSQALSNQPRCEWEIQARLDAEGVDLSSSMKVYVNGY